MNNALSEQDHRGQRTLSNSAQKLQILHRVGEVHDSGKELLELSAGRAGKGKALDMALQPALLPYPEAGEVLRLNS
ncbi:predicted protein [Streptomyces viridochromogenes DSM 40736]|uniref:Predicted protein n=1 Tax=Streptomyces viridochromogenes (strain DSM 40736 / JCM 4977 / BCRC 1201 / Tue 494) TaxID=591159 RepID=D9XHQ1_STRVT|nr:hypothetical protein [Streptomyces viridochromogenes]EFL37080.1 predicted protein [Streptomyces viridochromogenes DSM 40736]